ncbi:MAG TPA: MgtC/SapB family protein [Usitatibacter sp.]|nr:MgtC/SapB family protein [Usitatibacter sp.]
MAVTESIPIFDWLPPEGFKILLVLFLSFLLGLEREEHGAGEARRGSFGGVRTFPLIGLTGYALALLSGSELWAVALGFVAISGFLLLSYWHKLTTSPQAGVTSEMSALTTYLIGALVSHDQYWIATTLSVASVILLELKTALESLARRTAPEDILTFTKFLLLAAVILPVVPNRDLTPFQINPFRTWLVVVAVSGISYGSYVIRKMTKERGGVLLAAVLGGAYSSTMTTVVLAKKAQGDTREYLVSGAILVASGTMYLRLSVLLALFNHDLMRRLAPAFLVLAAVGIGTGWLWTRRDTPDPAKPSAESELGNPLEIRTALGFALLFVAMLVASHLAVQYLGSSGVYALAGVMGVTDVDPFILSMTQAGDASMAPGVAASAILIAAASNNVIKGIYAYALAPRGTGRKSLLLLLALAAAGSLPLLW